MKLSRRFPLNALRVFEATARLRNFTRAAEELGMTQTAVSYQIKLLEDHLGAPVFLRRPRALELTEAGTGLLPKVAEAFSLLSEAMANAQQTVGETLEVHAMPTFASQWLARRLRSFQAAHPNISVRLLRVGKTTDFRSTTADVAIDWSDTNVADVEYIDLLRPAYTPVLSPRLAESIGGIRTPADILRLPIISPRDRWWRLWFEAAGLSDPDLPPDRDNIFESQDLEVSAALADQGVAIISPFFFRDELASGRLVQPFRLCLDAKDPIRLSYPAARRHAPKIRAFRTWIEEAIAPDRAEAEEAARPSLGRAS